VGLPYRTSLPPLFPPCPINLRQRVTGQLCLSAQRRPTMIRDCFLISSPLHNRRVPSPSELWTDLLSHRKTVRLRLVRCPFSKRSKVFPHVDDEGAVDKGETPCHFFPSCDPRLEPRPSSGRRFVESYLSFSSCFRLRFRPMQRIFLMIRPPPPPPPSSRREV